MKIFTLLYGNVLLEYNNNNYAVLRNKCFIPNLDFIYVAVDSFSNSFAACCCVVSVSVSSFLGKIR